MRGEQYDRAAEMDAQTEIACDCCHGTVNEDESDGGICNDCYSICSFNNCRVLGD